MFATRLFQGLKSARHFTRTSGTARRAAFRRPPTHCLRFEPLEHRLCLATFTVNVVDQFGAEIAGSAVSVPGVGLVATGSAVTLPDGDHTFGVMPKILNTDPFSGPQLRRDELFEVTSTTTEVVFEWITSDIVLRLHDQYDVDIPGATIFATNPGGSRLTPVIPTGQIVTLPITDENVYPTLSGDAADGYYFVLRPGLGGNLQRSTLPAEITATTTEAVYEWITISGPLRVVDENENEIAGSEYRFSSGVVFATGNELSLPITDNAIYPTLAGIWADGYDISIRPDGAEFFSEYFDFELTSDAIFSPPFVSIDGASVGLRFMLDVIPPEVLWVDVGTDLKSLIVQLTDDDLDPALAENVANYRLIAANGRACANDPDPFDDGDELELTILAANYDPVADQVKLVVSDLLFEDYFRLELDGDGLDGPDLDLAGIPIPGGTPGITDVAGNFLSGGDFFADFDLTSLGMIDNLIAKVELLGLDTGPETSLMAKLEAITKRLCGNAPVNNGVIALLDAFVSGVGHWLSRDEILQQDHDDLIADAELIRKGITLLQEEVV